MARRKRKKAVVAAEEIVREDEVLPPPERGQHDQIERAQVSRSMPWGDRPPLYVATQTRLDRLRKRRHITQRQWDAGTRLYSEWFRSGCSARIISSYTVRIEGSKDISDSQAVLYREVQDALKECGGFAPILVHVCLHDMPPPDWGLSRGWPMWKAEACGIEYLRDGLSLLQLHYWPGERKS